jgi:hypothetical protein
MTRLEAIDKLIRIRSYCFHRGVIGRSPDADFGQAFRTLNRLLSESLRNR